MQQLLTVAQGSTDQALAWLQQYPDRIAFCVVAVILWIRGTLISRRMGRTEVKVAELTRAVEGLDLRFQRVFLGQLRDQGSTPDPVRTPARVDSH